MSLRLRRNSKIFYTPYQYLEESARIWKVPNVTATAHCQRSRNRFTLEDVDTAARIHSFDNVLGVDYDEDISDGLVGNAWRD